MFANSSADPTFLAISAVRVAKSPSKAACLAFSKFRFLPVNNSASSSLDIDCSKSSKLPAIASTLFKFRPNFRASIAALDNSWAFPLDESKTALLVVEISLIISWYLIADLLLMFDTSVWAIIASVCSLEFLPRAIFNLVNSVACSTDNPNLCCKVVKLAAVSALIEAVVPKDFAKESWASTISLPVTPAILLAASFAALAKSIAWSLPTFKLRAKETVFWSISVTALTAVPKNNADAPLLRTPPNCFTPATLASNALAPSAEASLAAWAAFPNSLNTALAPGILPKKPSKLSKNLTLLSISSNCFFNPSACFTDWPICSWE